MYMVIFVELTIYRIQLISPWLKRLFFWLHDLLLGYRGIFFEFPFVQFRYNHFPTIKDSLLIDASREAQNKSKLILIYVHRREKFAMDFCERVLANKEVVSKVDKNVIFWGIDSEDKEWEYVQPMLRKSSPYLGLFCHDMFLNNSNSGLNLTCIKDFDMKCEASAILRDLDQKIAMYNPIMELKTQEKLKSLEDDRQLIEEQNKRFEECSRKDAERESLKRAEEKLLETEQLKRAKLDSEIEDLERNLPAEPESNDQTYTLKFVLQHGGRIERCFHGQNTTRTLYNFVATKERTFDFHLLTQFPKKVIEKSDNITVDSIGLSKRDTLIVEEPF